MEVVKACPAQKTEKRVKLGKLIAGDVFRFANRTFEHAIADQEGASFYMVIEAQPKKTGRVTIIPLDGKVVLEKDDDHEVICHPATIEIGEAERV